MDPYGTPNYQILWALREIDKRDRSADVRVPLLDLLSPPLFNELCFERWDLMGLRWFRILGVWGLGVSARARFFPFSSLKFGVVRAYQAPACSPVQALLSAPQGSHRPSRRFSISRD